MDVLRLQIYDWYPQLSEHRIDELFDMSISIAIKVAMGNVQEAMQDINDANLEDDEYKALWNVLHSRCRSILKRRT